MGSSAVSVVFPSVFAHIGLSGHSVGWFAMLASLPVNSVASPAVVS